MAINDVQFDGRPLTKFFDGENTKVRVDSERLDAFAPRRAQWQRDLSVSYERLGNILVPQVNLDEALKSYREGLAIREGRDKSVAIFDGHMASAVLGHQLHHVGHAVLRGADNDGSYPAPAVTSGSMHSSSTIPHT